MKVLVLGRGKTGTLVAEVARERGHDVSVLCAADNPNGAALVPDRLADVGMVFDFTTPHAVIPNVEACIRAKKNVVVGTTGWYSQSPRMRSLVLDAGTGLVFGGNFSVGVNLFYEIARTAAAALKHEYSGQIFERHHIHKKDAPSGTAIALQQIVKNASGTNLEITSFREGEVVGLHELVLNSEADRIYLCHDAKSRQGFAEGAVRAGEWLVGRKGFFDFRDVWRELQ
ncbi:MAG TPA: dihydrodipicolinate reductase C-terminal domain-containing protein [Terriglobales bacterium]